MSEEDEQPYSPAMQNERVRKRGPVENCPPIVAPMEISGWFRCNTFRYSFSGRVSEDPAEPTPPSSVDGDHIHFPHSLASTTTNPVARHANVTTHSADVAAAPLPAGEITPANTPALNNDNNSINRMGSDGSPDNNNNKKKKKKKRKRRNRKNKKSTQEAPLVSNSQQHSTRVANHANVTMPFADVAAAPLPAGEITPANTPVLNNDNNSINRRVSDGSPDKKKKKKKKRRRRNRKNKKSPQGAALVSNSRQHSTRVANHANVTMPFADVAATPLPAGEITPAKTLELNNDNNTNNRRTISDHVENDEDCTHADTITSLTSIAKKKRTRRNRNRNRKKGLQESTPVSTSHPRQRLRHASALTAILLVVLILAYSILPLSFGH